MASHLEGASVAGDVIEADVVYQFLDGTALPPMESQWIDTEQGAIQGLACEAVVDKFNQLSRLAAEDRDSVNPGHLRKGHPLNKPWALQKDGDLWELI